MEECYLCLDVGGTQIKAASVGRDGKLWGELKFFPARAEEEKEALLAHFAAVMEEIRIPEAEVTGIRLAFPGPFDYEKGICLMRGLDKYDRLYGVNLRQEFAGRLNMPGERLRFINDVSAYALGEMGFGAVLGEASGAESGAASGEVSGTGLVTASGREKRMQRALFICIGTGCGSAFGVDGALAPPGTPGVPESGYVYDAPFLDGCVDDYISRRGLLALTRERLGTALDGKALAERVKAGDESAKECFFIFGCRVREALGPFLEDFRPDVLCFGGQITRSGGLFLPPVEEYCRRAGIRVLVTQDTSLRTLQGLTRM